MGSGANSLLPRRLFGGRLMDAILTFHSVDRSGSVLSFPPESLRRLLESLLESDVAVVSLRELIGARSTSRHRVALTFDDGLQSVHDEALPILRQLNLPAIVYVVSGRVGADNLWPSQPPGVERFATMSWDQLRAWRDTGLDIGDHTSTHEPLSGLHEPAWRAEIEESVARLEAELGVRCRHFAYPYGTLSDEAVARVRRLHDTAVTTKMGYLSASAEPHLLPRLDSYYLRGRPGAPLFSPQQRAYLAFRSMLRPFRRYFP